MQQNTNTNLSLTAQAWAEIVLENWLERIDKLGIGYSFDHEQSYAFDVDSVGDTPTQINLSYAWYMKFVDMGVGKGVRLEDVKSNRMEFSAGIGGSRRRPKKWYNKVLYREVFRLAQILSEKYGIKAVYAVKETLEHTDM